MQGLPQRLPATSTALEASPPSLCARSLQLLLPASYPVILKAPLQGDPGETWGWDQVGSRILGLGQQGSQQGEAQIQEN